MAGAKVEIYTRWGCGYCVSAKALLDRKGAEYQEIDVTMDRAGFDAMSKQLPILWQSRWAASDLLKPPYSKIAGMLKALVR